MAGTLCETVQPGLVWCAVLRWRVELRRTESPRIGEVMSVLDGLFEGR